MEPEWSSVVADFGLNYKKDSFSSRNKGGQPAKPSCRFDAPESKTHSFKLDGRYACQQCEKTFNSKSGLTYHMEKHTGNFRLWCYQCQRGFTMKAQFESHMAKHEGRTFPCEYCTKRFQSKPSLRAHVQRLHADQQPFQNVAQ